MAIKTSEIVDDIVHSSNLPGALIPQPEATKLDAAITNVTEVQGSSSSSSAESDNEENRKGQGLPFDPAALKARYDEEREKRLAANPDGVEQYRSIEDGDPVFGQYLLDPYLEHDIKRDPIDTKCDALIIGGGYGAQLVAVRLMEKGITDIKIIEKAGDFGGSK